MGQRDGVRGPEGLRARGGDREDLPIDTRGGHALQTPGADVAQPLVDVREAERELDGVVPDGDEGVAQVRGPDVLLHGDHLAVSRGSEVGGEVLRMRHGRAVLRGGPTTRLRGSVAAGGRRGRSCGGG
jgi:hypothetical protein